MLRSERAISGQKLTKVYVESSNASLADVVPLQGLGDWKKGSYDGVALIMLVALFLWSMLYMRCVYATGHPLSSMAL